MNFESNKSTESVGEKIGFIFSYFLFTTILFFILLILNKIPASWSFFDIMTITFLIALIGAVIKRLLK